jgi:hypothetical protein
MDIFDAINKTTYKETEKDYIMDFILSNFYEEKYHKIFLIKKKFKNDIREESIFLIEKIIEEYKNENGSKFLKISKILIYLIIDFIYKGPLIYLEKSNKHTIVPLQKNVNKQTYEINTNTLDNWKNNINNMNNIYDIYNININFEKVILEIRKSFMEIYPLYLVEIGKRENLYYPDESQIPLDIYRVNLCRSENNNNNNNSNNNNNNNIDNNKLNPLIDYYIEDRNTQRQKNINNSNKRFNFNLDLNLNVNSSSSIENKNEDLLKKILIENTINTLTNKIKSEYICHKKINTQLENIKASKDFSVSNIINKIEQGKKILIAYENEMKNLKNLKSEIKEKIIKISNTKMSFENYKNFVEISENEEKIIQLISLEITYEDFVHVIKKNFSIGKITYEYSCKLIREISKEIFKINFYKEKLEKGLL